MGGGGSKTKPLSRWEYESYDLVELHWRQIMFDVLVDETEEGLVNVSGVEEGILRGDDMHPRVLHIKDGSRC